MKDLNSRLNIGNPNQASTLHVPKDSADTACKVRLLFLSEVLLREEV